MAEGYLRVQLWEFGSKHFQQGNPAVYTSEAVFGPLALLLRGGTPLAGRLDAAYGRFERIPQFLEQARENVPQAPRRWIEKAIEECIGGVKFATGGVPMFLAEHGVEHEKLVAAAARAGQAFEEYRSYLRDEMLPNALDDGYGSGQEGLDLAIRDGHHLEMTAAEIVDYARGVMEESRTELENGAAAFGGGDWQQILGQLADSHPSAEEYRGAFQQVWDAARESAIEQELVTWPDYPIRYVERYPWVRSAAPHLYFLFYRAPSAFNQVDVVDYLVMPLPDDDPEQCPASAELVDHQAEPRRPSRRAWAPCPELARLPWTVAHR